MQNERTLNTYLISLLKVFAGQDEELPVRPEENGISLEELYKLCQMHNVTAISYTVLKQIEPDENALKKFKEAMVGAVFRSTLLDNAISEVTDQFEKEGIPYTILKGYRIKEDYPIPELRTMGDVDFLIDKKYRTQMDKALTEIGYEKEGLEGSTWVYKQAGIMLEMHSKLASGNYWNDVDYEKYFSGYFSRLKKLDHSCEKLLSLEDHFIFLIFHFAKHLNSSGAGIRMVLDLAFYLKRHIEEINWQYMKEELKNISLLEFAENVLFLCHDLFGTQIPWEYRECDSKLLEQLLGYIMQGGIFGFERPDSIRRLRQGIGQQNLSGNRRIQILALLKLIFPGRKHMMAFLPAVEKHIWLLPAAWVKRWKMGIENKKRVEDSLSGFNKNVEEAKEQYRLLKQIGL